ncbi:S-adenosylmethionine decarboxylase [Roseisolibacter sp. H3M3-2]|uniref:S-adenosylmethionine decarboxylase n=1 Tax=Roseisolibacter sp. H3M3-2 TaxID=3031323 RepID=UPI0023DC4630|nr:S-adenosylmethionine decarboxylase [Roseisolibacter sp. H3M3-2]MDF1502459.1 S-adenosylmethionine decarboxylase [Roseisolibacter sp. H3M3-2]
MPDAPSPAAPPAPFTHVAADFLGVPAAQLRDAALIGGLLVAAAGAVGLAARAAPSVRALRRDGVAALHLLEGCHIAVQTFPREELLLLDLLVRGPADAGARGTQRAVDVFARRLAARAVHTQQRPRG